MKNPDQLQFYIVKIFYCEICDLCVILNRKSSHFSINRRFFKVSCLILIDDVLSDVIDSFGHHENDLEIISNRKSGHLSIIGEFSKDIEYDSLITSPVT